MTMAKNPTLSRNQCRNECVSFASLKFFLTDKVIVFGLFVLAQVRWQDMNWGMANSSDIIADSSQWTHQITPSGYTRVQPVDTMELYSHKISELLRKPTQQKLQEQTNICNVINVPCSACTRQLSNIHRSMLDCGHTTEVFIYYKENYHNSSIMQPSTSYQSKRLLSVNPCFIQKQRS